jgi:signal transduction histidine kinase
MPKVPKDDSSSDGGAHLQEINQEIYKRNLELAVVNKTLSLLRKLYQISLLSLDPASLSEKISETIRVDLNMEVVGVFLYDKSADSLNPFKFAQSERLAASEKKSGFALDGSKILGVAKIPLLQEVVISKNSKVVTNLEDVWGSVGDAAKLTAVAQESHLKTLLLYPLVTQNEVIGMLFLGLNRDYETLSEFEQDSIKSFIDVVAVALDKALLYEKLDFVNKELQALDKARAEFISIASHQLRTPPATIKWYVAAILSGDFGVLGGELKAALERVQSTNNSQISLIDDLLNASRIERGKMEFFFEMGDLVELAKITYEQLVPQAEIKKLKLIYNPPTEAIPQVMMDKEKVRQVINNFIDNAIKYTKQGQVSVGVEKTATDVVIRVTDTGRGVAPEVVPTLFQKYTRGKDSASAATGLGLGLYVAKVIISENHGKIWVESPGEGKGASFLFSLPIKSTLEATSVVDLTDAESSHK